MKRGRRENRPDPVAAEKQKRDHGVSFCFAYILIIRETREKTRIGMRKDDEQCIFFLTHYFISGIVSTAIVGGTGTANSVGEIYLSIIDNNNITFYS